MGIKYEVMSYHPLIFKYANSCQPSDKFISFDEWLVEQGYKFRVKDRIFNNFEEMWAYREMLSMQLCQNITFEIVKEEILCDE